MRFRCGWLVTLGVACGGGGNGVTDAQLIDGRGSGSGSVLPVPTYLATPAQTLVAPGAAGEGYGRAIAISTDGLKLATHDASSIYVFARASGSDAFPATPTQTWSPSEIEGLGEGISLSADGAVLACGAVGSGSGSGSATEILVFAQVGPAYATTPQQVIPVTTSGPEIPAVALEPNGQTLAYTDGSDSFDMLPLVGSAYSTTALGLRLVGDDSTSGLWGTGLAWAQPSTTFAVADMEGAGFGKGGGSGEVEIFDVGSDLSFISLAEILPAPAGTTGYGTAITLRADAAELAASTGVPAEVAISQRGSASYAVVQTLTTPAPGDQSFGIGVALAADGTLVVSDSSGTMFIYAP
jgi:hypothetical protein